MVTTVSESFWKSKLVGVPLHPLNALFRVEGANGQDVKYLGFVEVDMELSEGIAGREQTHSVPVLVVVNTQYNAQVPFIIGTNVIRRCFDFGRRKTGQQFWMSMQVQPAWQMAFNSFQAASQSPRALAHLVTSSRIQLAPGETVVVSARTEADWKYGLTSKLRKSRLLVEPSLVEPEASGNQQRNFLVEVKNGGRKAITLSNGTTLCALESVSVLEGGPEGLDDRDRIEPTFDLGEVKDDKERSTSAKEVLHRWETIFARKGPDLGDTGDRQHQIPQTDETPFRCRTTNVPPAMYEEVRQHLKEMYECGAIRPSNSPYSSPVVLVRKKDGSLRFCIDMRRINARTPADAYPVPRIEETLDALKGSQWFSTLDLKSGYWQVPLAEKDKHKTALTVGGLGFWECNRMPFGLKNAGATFQRLMENCLGDLQPRMCLIYLDDVIVHSRTFEDQLKNLEMVFQRLRDYGLKLKPSKCKFFRTRLQYLGHVVSSQGVETDPEKTEALREWPVPRNPAELHTFFGVTGYYRRFVEGYARTVRPLQQLMVGHVHKGKRSHQKKTQGSSKKKKKPVDAAPWIWTDQCQHAFQTIIDRLVNPPILAYPDYDKPFVLHTDASLEGLGAALYQIHEGIERPVAYASRTLSKSERNYPVHKLEFLALKWAVTEKFQHYLYGRQFLVRTDNNPLAYVLTTAKLDATGHRWLAALANYHFSIQYRPGRRHGDADGFSRRPVQSHDDFEEMDVDTIRAVFQGYGADDSDSSCGPVIVSLALQTTATEPETERTLISHADWRQRQRGDAAISRVMDLKLSGQRPRSPRDESPQVRALLREWPRLHVRDGILVRVRSVKGHTTNQLVLPEQHRHAALAGLHDNMGHLGVERTLDLARDRFFWPKMAEDIQIWISSCKRCVCRKHPERKASPLVSIKTNQPMELVCMDYLTLESSKGGYENILVITDHFTRYAQAIPTRNQTASTTAKALFENFIVHYGFPARLHSDQGRNFESKVIRDLCKIAGVRKSRTTPYHPMGNGMCERFNQTLLAMLGTLTIQEKANWKSHVAPLVHAYNATKHESLGCSPFSLMFGREPRLPVDVTMALPLREEVASKDYAAALRDRLQKAYDIAKACAEEASRRQKKNYDVRVREAVVAPGDRVLVKAVGHKGKHKLSDVWEDEPYRVQSQPNHDIPVYVVQREDGHGRCRTLHRNMLLPVGHLEFRAGTETRQMPSSRQRQRTRVMRARPESSSSSSETEFFVPVLRPPAQHPVSTLPTPPGSSEDLVLDGVTQGPGPSAGSHSSPHSPDSVRGRSSPSSEDVPHAVAAETTDPNHEEVVVHTPTSSTDDEDSGQRRSQRNRRMPDWYGVRLSAFDNVQTVEPAVLDWRRTGAAVIWTPWWTLGQRFSKEGCMSPRCFFHIVVQIFFLHVSSCLLSSCCWRHGVVMLTHRDFSLSHFLSKDALDGPSRISWNQMRLHHHCCSLLSAWFHREQTCGTCTSETRGARAPAHDGLTLW